MLVAVSAEHVAPVPVGALQVACRGEPSVFGDDVTYAVPVHSVIAVRSAATLTVYPAVEVMVIVPALTRLVVADGSLGASELKLTDDVLTETVMLGAICAEAGAATRRTSQPATIADMTARRRVDAAPPSRSRLARRRNIFRYR